MGEVTAHPTTGRGPKFQAPSIITAIHDLSAFDSGKPDLDDWLRRKALKSGGQTARSYVVCVDGNRVIGYYCLAAGGVQREVMPNAKFRRNTPIQVPVIILGRLAVDKNYQHQGIGSGLLKDALSRAIQASQAIGIRAILVHALDEDAVAFYKQYGFTESPVDHRTLILPIETAIAALR